MTDPRINLYSDTQTRPTPEMRRAMAEAEVGDEQRGEDPSVNCLCEAVAALLGQEAAVFLPSGTMCNEIAILVHCRPGDEIMADRTAHILNFEGGGPSAFAGAQIQPLPGERGVFTLEQMTAAIRQENRYAPRSRMVSIEQSANLGGGTVWPLETVRQITGAAREHGLARHMDGARLLNAVVASGVSAAEFGRHFDSLWIDLSKGLGCPVGGVLAGSAAFIAEAWRWKQRMGGAMRQAGILAAAGLYALDHHVDRLAEDNDNARLLAERLALVPGVALDPATVETNIVLFDVTGTRLSAAEIARRTEQTGVRFSVTGEYQLRALTHLDVTRAQVEEAAETFAAVLSNA